MSPSSEHALAREQQILDAAALVFAHHGFAATRMEDIARACGLSKGTLYWYFENKEALILGLLRRLLADQLHSLQTVTSSDGPVHDRLLLFAQQFMDALVQLPDLVCLLLEFYALAARQDEARQFFRAFFNEYRNALAALLQQGMTQHELRAVDPAAAAQVLIALFEGTMLLYAFGSLTTSLPQSFANAVRFSLEGLQASLTVEREEQP